MNLRFIIRDGEKILQSEEKVSKGFVVEEHFLENYDKFYGYIPGVMNTITSHSIPREIFEYEWVDIPLVTEDSED